MDSVWRDVRYALRTLARSPGFALVIIATLALGVGVNTAVFSVANFAVLRPLPVKDPQQLVVLATREKTSSEIRDVSYPDFLDYRRQATAFSDMLAYQLSFDSLAADNRAEQVIASYVTGNYFQMLGIRPAIGRLIEPGEGWTRGADPVVVLGYSYWQRRFAGDPGVVGKAALLDGRPVTIIGVAQKGFAGLYYFIEMDAYVPLGQSQAGADFWTARGKRGMAGLFVFGRLKPGTSLKQGRASLNTVAARPAQQDPEAEKGISIESFPERLARPQASAANDLPVLVPLFLSLALVVLMVACINVANLVLARANERAAEMAIRSSLGAGSVRLLRQLLTESLVLAILGGAAAIVLGKWLAKLLERICTPVDFPMFRIQLAFDWRVFAYALGITLLAGTIVGLIPARRMWRSELNPTLHEAGRTLSGGPKRQRRRNALLVAQTAGSAMLLIVAGLFVHMLERAQHMDLGFDPGHVLDLRMDVRQLGYDETRGRKFYEDIVARLSALPGVEAVTDAYSVPFGSNGTFSASVYHDDPAAQPEETPSHIFYNVVGPNYFTALRVPVLRGRVFTASDTESSPRVGIVSQKMAEVFWPGQDPVGKRFRIGKDGASVEVVGVAHDAKYVNPVPWSIPYFYLPLAQHYTPERALQIRSPLPVQTLLREAEEQIHAREPALALTDVFTLEQQIHGANGFFLLNLGADAAAGLGILALLLALIGIYGVVSYAAGRRTHEIGIRLALGAQRSDILRMILRQGLALVAIGAAAGIAGASVVAHAVSRFLMGVSPNDPITFFGVLALLGATTLLAIYLPARRAMLVDPMVALRHE